MQKLVDPTGAIAGVEGTGETWQLDLNGQTLGLLCNGKAKASDLLEAVARRLGERFDLAGLIRADKSQEAAGPARPATPEIIDRLSSGAVAVLVASGD